MRYSRTKKIRLQWAKNKKHVNNGYRLEKQMRYSRIKKMPFEFTAADRIYFDKSINLAACMKENFQDELESLDFRTKAEEGRMEINNWIANVTRNKIPEMLNPCDVTSDSQMVLANAAYFKVQWSDKFDAKDTKQEIFYTNPSQYSFVIMRHKRGEFEIGTDSTQLCIEHTANLNGFSTETSLMFGDAEHVVKIKVDEEGSTAAAATVVFSFRSARPAEPTKFECNHPFMFLIYDNTAKAVLFTGIYRDPKTQK
ncbi:serine protease inhibitor 88Ea-like [Musca vetustissima]|uniref:serine protease inhibitor 88Ea-like n=1 Tax=Musca vetustissima TaxID=27455 RepID=UPI002AB7D202|nr:serine protease inhibitor 88Ea-like [Musca vetustissima]